VNQTGRQIFREEVFRHRTDRLYGNISLATPMVWQLISYLLLAAVAAAIAFLSLASYARIENVLGTITLDSGVSLIVPTRAGIVREVDVREGQRVTAGMPLVRIRSEEQMLAGSTAPARIRQSLAEQASRLSAGRDFLAAAATAERARLAAQIAGLNSEIANLDSQISDQRRLVQVATDDFVEIQRVAQGGFISRRDVEAREATVISRRQQLAQFQQLRDAKAAELEQTRRAMAEAAATAAAQIANSESGRIALTQQLAQAESSEGYALVAPIDGIATGVTARVGQAVAPPRQLMTVLPENAHLVAELYVPSSAAGFLAPGQEVRIAIDAFPYQRFGTIGGRIASISRAAVERPSGDAAGPVFLVSVRLARGWVDTAGRRLPLLPGMTLSARIVTEQRTLIQWVFEPIFAMRER
jgi:membrane fusion protein